jgi:hypothetical protein
MSAPKRTVFSINYDAEISDLEPIRERSTNRVESRKPTHEHADLTYATKPFERLGNRVVDDVVRSTSGTTVKKLTSKNAEGELRYSSSIQEASSSTGSGNLNIKNKSKRRAIERKYDTSEL